jgi:hypothetical protein
MIKAGTLSLAALCSCAIDNRNVEGPQPQSCVNPPQGGLLSDFSTARLGRCMPTTCPDPLAYTPTVSLGMTGVPGLVFPYRRPESVVLALGLTGDLGVVSDDASALRVVMSYDSLGQAPPPVVGGFALRFLACVDTSGYAGVSFRTDGALGTCPLRVALQFTDGGSATLGTPCALDECFADSSVAVTAGTLTVPIPAPRGAEGPHALVGMQWELGVPSDGARTCNANFTIDDISLVAKP